MREFAEGSVRDDGGAAFAFDLPDNGSHWNVLLSAPNASAAAPVDATLVLIGQSGECELFSGPLTKAAGHVELPVTLPGQKLVMRAAKPAKLAMDISWIHHGPVKEVDLCAR